METTALHRANDPDTSVAAAKSLQSVARLEELVLRFVRACGKHGATTEEISDAMHLPRVTVSPRMKPLEKKGFVKATEERRKGLSGRPSIVWVAI
jgi:predicted ArsR family transcriptional regulator